MISKENQQKVFDYIDTQMDRYVEELSELVRHRSMSCEGTGMEEGANAVAELLRASGFEAKVNMQEKGFPVVTGGTGHNGKKTLGLYGHYDVFPEGDTSAWIVDPYDPKVIDGKLYGRATTDDKGNLFSNIKAAESVQKILGELPVDVQFLFEGEEEIGSQSLREFLSHKKDEMGPLNAFIACDRGWHETGRPQIFLGCKSNVTFTLILKTNDRNIHSGQAPIVPNPAWPLLHVLAKIRDDKDKILIPALRDRELELSESDIALLKTIPFSISDYKDSYKLAYLENETSDFDTVKDLVFKTSCNINNLIAGYEGANGIIPGCSTVTVDMRITSDFDPFEIERSLREYVKGINPDVQIKTFVMRGYRASADDPFVKNVLKVAEDTFSAPVVWPSWDGSGPLGILSSSFDVPAIIIGLGAPFSLAHTHSCNEYIGLDNIRNSVKLMASIIMNALED